MTPARARALGITAPKKPGRSRTTAKGPYYTRCTTCREEFHAQILEDRHLETTTHRRFELVWLVDSK